MPDINWKPHTTVAAICENQGKFLLVKEKDQNRIVFNQPAGHLEPNETLIEAVIRETLEETQYVFVPSSLLGIYRYRPNPSNDQTYFRYLFGGETGENLGGLLDPDIISAQWMSYSEVLACRDQHRSPLVLQSIDDYRNKPSYPLSLLRNI